MHGLLLLGELLLLLLGFFLLLVCLFFCFLRLFLCTLATLLDHLLHHLLLDHLLALCVLQLLLELGLECCHLAQGSFVLLAALLLLAHLPLQRMHGLLLLGELPGFLLLSLFSFLAGSLCCLFTCLLCFPHLGCHLLLQSCHLAQGSLVLFAALLVFAHLPLERMHGLLLLGELLLLLLGFFLLLVCLLFTCLLACLLCFPHLGCHLLL